MSEGTTNAALVVSQTLQPELHIYIYKLEGTDWIQQAIIIGSDTKRYDQFGCATSINGDYAVVGTKIGVAYIFKREGTDWIEQNKLSVLHGSTNVFFGDSVSICGDYALIGAPQDNDPKTNSGSVYIFKREEANWEQYAKLTASDGDVGDHFGSSVLISGDYSFVGAPDDDDDIIGTDTGSVYVFKREGTSWIELDKLTAYDAEYGDKFGNSISVGTDYIMIGAEGDDDNGNNSGSAYIFRLDDIVGM